MGRAVLTRGDFASVDELPAKRRKAPLAYAPSPKLAAPPWVPSGLLRASTVRAFNEVWFRKAPSQHTGYESIPYFFHPLDGVLEWNRIYGRAGFIQYQFAVPLDADETVREALGRLAAARCPSFLTVLKRFGPGNPGPLSFPHARLDPHRRRPRRSARARAAARRAGRDRRASGRARLPFQGQQAASRPAGRDVSAARRVARPNATPSTRARVLSSDLSRRLGLT